MSRNSTPMSDSAREFPRNSLGFAHCGSLAERFYWLSGERDTMSEPTGTLEVEATLDVAQLWPASSSDADTLKIRVASRAGSFRFRSSARGAFHRRRRSPKRRSSVPFAARRSTRTTTSSSDSRGATRQRSITADHRSRAFRQTRLIARSSPGGTSSTASVSARAPRSLSRVSSRRRAVRSAA